MSENFDAEFARRYGLERLWAADPAAFAAALDRTGQAGAAMARPGDKESGPAPVFRPSVRRSGNEPALIRASPAAGLPVDDPDAARLTAELKNLDEAVAGVTAALGFYEEPGQYAAAQRRLA